VKLGLLGGSFDPIHEGHVAAARAALRDLGLDRVLFLPTGRPPHKPERRFAPALARYAMVELALLDEPELQVSALELDESAPSYAIETVERLRAERPGDELVLLLGADSLAQLHTWRRWRDLVATTRLGVLARPGWNPERIAAAQPPDLAAAVTDGIHRATISQVESVSHPASASEIRRRLRAREPIPEGWLHDRVLKFSAKYDLYR
jgi:nicotinate-nucleotide adenylyltransferase